MNATTNEAAEMDTDREPWMLGDEMAFRQSRKAYDQGAADHGNGAGQNPIRGGDDWKGYLRGWYDAAEYAGEASLRYAESGAAYEAYLDARSPISQREEEEMRATEDLYREFDTAPYDRESGFERDPFMARVLAYGEEAQRQADNAWTAGAAARKAAEAVLLTEWKDAIPF